MVQKRFHRGSGWIPIDDDVDLDVLFDHVHREAPDPTIEQLHRTIVLKHVGAAIGSNGLLASVLLVSKAVQTGADFDTALGVGSSVLALTLIAVCWIKGADQTQYAIRSFAALKNSAAQPQ